MQIKSITDLNADLCRMYEDLRSGKMEAKDAIEANNTAGKIIGAAKVQLAYHALRGERPEIPFLASPPFPAVQQLVASGEKQRVKAVAG